MDQEIKDFKAALFDDNQIILQDRKEVPELLRQIKGETDFTITYKDDDEDWVTELVLGSWILPKFNNGEIRIGGLVTQDEIDEDENGEWD